MKYPLLLTSVALILLEALSNVDLAPLENNASAAPFVAGGKLAKHGETPYQLTIYSDKRPFCGAALVEVDGFQIGLTAAHCISINPSPFYDLVAGIVNLENATGIGQKRRVERVLIHPDYPEGKLRNDIAILFLNSPFKTTKNVKAVPLPKGRQVTDQGSLTVSGWGNLIFGNQSPQLGHLGVVKVPIINDADCQKAYRSYFVNITDTVICGGRAEGNVATCNGDGGGPAVSDKGYLAGIVSFGQECGDAEYPAVFTKVSHFIGWIEEAVQNARKTFKINLFQ